MMAARRWPGDYAQVGGDDGPPGFRDARGTYLEQHCRRDTRSKKKKILQKKKLLSRTLDVDVNATEDIEHGYM